MVKPSGRGGRPEDSGGAGVRSGRLHAQRIQSVDRAVELLKAVAAAEGQPTVAELAGWCGLNRTTAWRLLATLEEHGLVERDAGQRYGIGYGMVGLAQSQSWSATLVRIARPPLERLCDETGNSVTLSLARHGGVVAIDQVNPPDAVLLLNYLSLTLPLHATSSGKVLLATLTDDELDDALATPLDRRTPATVTNRRRLREIIATVRRDGYALTIGELDLGVNGVSLAVTDEQGALVAVVSVTDTDHRLPAARLTSCLPAMRDAVDEIERRLAERL